MSGPALTPARVDSLIVVEQYANFEGTPLVVCCLTLANGHAVVGHSDTGVRAIALGLARQRVWELEGYLMRQRHFAERVDVVVDVAAAGVAESDAKPV